MTPSEKYRLEANYRMIFKYHPVLGYWYRPGICMRIASASLINPPYSVRTNSQGARSTREFHATSALSRKRVLFLGCSFCAGDGVSNEGRFSDSLESKLDVDTYNVALSGSGHDQQLLAHDLFAPVLRPDALVIAPYSGCAGRNVVSSRDILDPLSGLIISRPKPWFRLAGEELVLCNSPVPHRIFTGGKQRALDDSSMQPALPAHDRIHTGIDESGYRLTMALITSIVHRSSAKLKILLPIPSEREAVQGKGSYQSFFQTAAKLSGASFLDIMPAMHVAATSKNGRPYLDNDGHLSSLGHAIISDQLATFLRSCPDICA